MKFRIRGPAEDFHVAIRAAGGKISRTHTAITVLRRQFVFLKTHFILSYITHDLKRKAISEEPVSPECRLAICLHRLGRGD